VGIRNRRTIDILQRRAILMIEPATFSALRLSRIDFDIEYLGGQWHEELIDGVQFFFPASDGNKLGVVEVWGSGCVMSAAVRGRPEANSRTLKALHAPRSAARDSALWPSQSLKTCRAEARVIARGEALIIHRDAVVERLGIGDHRACVPGCVQELPHEVVLPNPFGTGHIERAVERLSEGHIGHDRGDVSAEMLHQNRRKPNRLPFSRELGDAAHELEELRSTHDCVRNRGSLD
jgi:hypothetical protein